MLVAKFCCEITIAPSRSARKFVSAPVLCWGARRNSIPARRNFTTCAKILGQFIPYSKAIPVAEEKRKNRWLVNTVLVGATLALMGTAAYPMFMLMGKTDANVANTAANPSPNSAGQPSPNASQSPQANPIEDLKKQAEAYSLVLQREPENQTALRGLLEARLGLVRVGQGDVKSAIEPLEKLVKISPQDTKLAVLLAQARQQNKEPESAAQVYRDVLQKQPGELNALGGLSALLIEQKRPESAVSLLKDTLKEADNTNKAAPGSVDKASVQILLGKVYASEKRFDEAIVSFDNAAKDNPQNFQPVYYKAALLKEQGKLDQAKPLFEKAAALAPAEVKDQINREASGKDAKAEGGNPEGAKPEGVNPEAPLAEPKKEPAKP
jgi:Flp pilus assembly protein TadD